MGKEKGKHRLDNWMQVIVNRVPVDSLVIGVDLNPIGPIQGAMSIEFVTTVDWIDCYVMLVSFELLFEKVEVTKPAASRSTSAEIYVVGLKYKAPAKIDPRLLDVKHLFQGAIEPPKVLDVLREKTKQKRHRDGYEEGLSIVRKVTSAANFVWSDNYLEILGTMTSISFQDPDSLPLKIIL
ncbi:hypothetical protein Droror1_Dr00021050 [Drosera rotundifolia]